MNRTQIKQTLAIACAKAPDGISVAELSALCGVPVPTLRRRLGEMHGVEVQKGRGRIPSLYWAEPWEVPEPVTEPPTPVGDLSRMEEELLRLADDWQLQPEVATAFNVAAMALRFGIKQKENN
jgi:hypothetical protein